MILVNDIFNVWEDENLESPLNLIIGSGSFEKISQSVEMIFPTVIGLKYQEIDQEMQYLNSGYYKNFFGIQDSFKGMKIYNLLLDFDVNHIDSAIKLSLDEDVVNYEFFTRKFINGENVAIFNRVLNGI